MLLTPTVPRTAAEEKHPASNASRLGSSWETLGRGALLGGRGLVQQHSMWMHRRDNEVCGQKNMRVLCLVQPP